MTLLLLLLLLLLWCCFLRCAFAVGEDVKIQLLLMLLLLQLLLLSCRHGSSTLAELTPRVVKTDQLKKKLEPICQLELFQEIIDKGTDLTAFDWRHTHYNRTLFVRFCNSRSNIQYTLLIYETNSTK